MGNGLENYYSATGIAASQDNVYVSYLTKGNREFSWNNLGRNADFTEFSGNVMVKSFLEHSSQYKFSLSCSHESILFSFY
jgi:hypothetical protein